MLIRDYICNIEVIRNNIIKNPSFLRPTKPWLFYDVITLLIANLFSFFLPYRYFFTDESDQIWIIMDRTDIQAIQG
jgi:hypothetical protein